jgi:hypothetical protein
MEDAKEGKRPHFVNKCKPQKFLLKALAQVTSAIETISIKPKLILYVFMFLNFIQNALEIIYLYSQLLTF